ncbi:hypothetical protein F2A31_08320 [Acinetobacter suaedae]|uniref:DUF3325 domain-containing protein n=1 Tax=Acinetobacter suaedae TaxID=2609668 RepID=A0A5P1UVQ2_9GAMM|nr:hypothetical protein [Acinetobacter sp. C16S1]QER39717.1 hypothetical protein F2A31_08320 [Acinetobacter sp. C16S1]
MSFASLFWAITAFMQSCMLSKFGQKHLQYTWLQSERNKKYLIIVCVVMFIISLWMNYRFEGLSVGLLTWLFVIIPTAFFIQVLFFYRLRGYFLFLWKTFAILAFIISVLEL